MRWPRRTAQTAPTADEVGLVLECHAPDRVVVSAAHPAEHEQLRAALEHQRTWTREFAEVGDVASAADAMLDAEAICAELGEQWPG